ncbi:PREDICTED: elongation factor Ts, mitochondrial-like [Priapulus caudatus]|uniref:Elongation factor Ts, mitochondrial n=1 Tax=Priapulus caudatus TaxID=37621 RepID=A0ABM1ERN6_PRICU|nr:PREDICTED: elongation factor Ts, mitochondrial-like [Priapulus caudatus]XP_014674857.1 PREDICTED: elongation factor Ts, mitochondrial-like [Priapulus caudatus]
MFRTGLLVTGARCKPVSLSLIYSYATSSHKTLLAKLRKKTGFPFINCKKALEKHDDFDAALAWLKKEAQKEGWSKATKLQGRTTRQGLVGIVLEKNLGVIVEVNCETDFVARNDKFRGLVASAAKSALKHCRWTPVNGPLVRVDMAADEIGALGWSEGGKTLRDAVALQIGALGENMSVRRAVCLRPSADVRLAAYLHPPGDRAASGECATGKFGAVVAYRGGDEDDAGRLAEQLCQHIVGMNPTSVGRDNEQDTAAAASPSTNGTQPVKVEKEVEGKVQAEGEPEEDEDGFARAQPFVGEDEEETRLWHQEFLIDPQLTVGEVLVQNNLEIVDFVRFECGESLEKED